MGLPLVVFPGDGRSAFQIYRECELPYAYHIRTLVSVAFLETKLLELKPTSLSRIAQLKLDFFNTLLNHAIVFTCELSKQFGLPDVIRLMKVQKKHALPNRRHALIAHG